MGYNGKPIVCTYRHSFLKSRIYDVLYRFGKSLCLDKHFADSSALDKLISYMAVCHVTEKSQILDRKHISSTPTIYSV